jgi:hypothetical protein
VRPTVHTLKPQSLVQEATSLDLRTFLAKYGDAPLLLVRIPAGDTEIELGLAAANGPNTKPGRAATPKPLPFNTGFQDEPPSAMSQKPAMVEPRIALRRRLEKDDYFAVPLHKREDSDAISDRISVGRAHNKDVVLRHSSISKFHAWFEVDEGQTVYVADADSTNGTQLNGQALKSKTTTALAPGDSITFGAIETVLCTADVLWSCLNG